VTDDGCVTAHSITAIIYIIKIGWFVCGQLCDWSVRSVGLASAQRRLICAGRAHAYARAGHARSAGQSVIQAENERSEFSACYYYSSI